MPPNAEHVPISTLGILPPKNRHKGFQLTGEIWLKEKQDTDGAEGLWRIENELFDFSDFVKSHPGGKDWLAITKGTDITEAFNTHHVTELPYEIRKKYFVRKATTKRNAPFTFHENGFYMTLKREVSKLLPTLPKQPYHTSKFMVDSTSFFLFLFSILAVRDWSFGLGVLAAFFLGTTTIAAHNFVHQRDNIRMYYFQFSFMSFREFRISHALSHHLHTNTIDDLEISMWEPILQYLPIEKKPLQKYAQLIMAPLFWVVMFHQSMFRRIIEMFKGKFGILDYIAFTSLPISMYIFGGQTLLHTLIMYNFIIMLGSTHYGTVAIHAAHQHPDIFHDGDAARTGVDYDWGIGQLDAIMDRHEVTGSHFLVLTNFGDHCLHHLFPTIDHGMLEHLYPKFKEVMAKFDVNLRMTSHWDLFKGGFQQLMKTEPNKNPPDLRKSVEKCQ